nr:unnamed protein product [Callosobruchus analis]
MSLQRLRFLLRCLRFDDLNTHGERMIPDKCAKRIYATVLFYLNNKKNLKRRLFLKRIGLDLISDGLKRRALSERTPESLKRTVATFSNASRTLNFGKRARKGNQQRCAECPRLKLPLNKTQMSNL